MSPLSASHLSCVFFFFAGGSASSCRLGWLMYRTVRLKKEFHTYSMQRRHEQQLEQLRGLSEMANDPPPVQTHTLKSKSASEKFLCSAGDRNCVVTTMMLQKANINAVSPAKRGGGQK